MFFTTFQQAFGSLRVDGKMEKVRLTRFDEAEVGCMKDYSFMPLTLNGPISQRYMIPDAEIYEHTIEFRPPSAGMLRVILSERTNTNIVLLYGDKVLAESFVAN